MAQSVLLLIDLINDIIHPKGATASCAQYAQDYQMIEKVNRVITLARARSIPIIFVNLGFSSDYREALQHSPLFAASRSKNAYQLGSWGCEIHQDIQHVAQDVYIIKHSVSPFYGTSLDLYLRRNGIKDMVVGGVATDMAIQSAVREGHDLGYQMTICEPICGARTHDVHLQSLGMLQRLAQICQIEELPSKF